MKFAMCPIGGFALMRYYVERQCLGGTRIKWNPPKYGLVMLKYLKFFMSNNL